ncbi:MAG: LuxR C-terminal-related transcriptional regulator [Chloroflexota bacterium]|nr:LuxR C-terminal-related transcriptional regulator [Chloroflexota bacterium]
MKTTLLQTKLYIPPAQPDPSIGLRARLVPRPRLIERLNAGLDRKMTLVSAPAGFGKTTLLSEWIYHLETRFFGKNLVSGSPRPVAWLSLDEGDNDPARFLAYLVAALQTVEPDVGADVLTALQSPQPPSVEAALTALINDIVAVPQGDRKGRPYVLMLDDYHLIAARPIHDALTFLIEHLPPQMHLVIATRADPPLPLARLRGRNQLTELHAADLRFTPDEAAAFLNQVMELDLLAEDVAALETRTEGWIAGLQMAAISMRGRKDVTAFIRAFTGSHRFILDYLVEEVLDQQSPAIQEFLLKTSILERMTGSLCDAVLSKGAEEQGSGGDGVFSPALPLRTSADSQKTLEYLEHNNLFVVPLDDERRWYRYHRLFADLLRQRLQQAQADLVPTLRRRASEWYEQYGLIGEAASHALAADDFERAARLIEQTAWKMLTRGEMTTLLNWLGALPDEVVRARPRLDVFRAWALTLTSQLDHAELRLQETDTQGLEGEVAAVRAYAACFRGDVTRAIELSRQALEHLPEEGLFLRSLMALNLGNAYWLSGNPAAAGQALTKAAALGQAAGDIYLAMIATSLLGQAQEMAGQLHQAVETYRQALQLATPSQGEGRGSRPVLFAGLAHLGLAGPLYEWNDLDGAMRQVMRAIELGERGGSVSTLQGSYTTLAQVCQARGDMDGALEALHQAESLARKHDLIHVIGLVAAFRARLWLAQGDPSTISGQAIAAASRWAQESGLSADDDLSYTGEIGHLTLAQVLIAQGMPGEALRLLARLLEAAQTAGRTGSVIEILALQALAFQAQSDLERALSALEQALSLAEPEGFVRIFLDLGEPMVRLLRRALSQGIAPNYVARLLAAFGEEVELTSPAMESLIEPLSERELEVLRLIAAGLSNPEIAEELVIAVSTVKSHTNHIYGKLGVKNRTQAVARARELDLL